MNQQLVFNELIQNILSLSKNENENLALSRNQICNGFSLPFILNYNFNPLPPQRPLSKHYFRIDNNTGIIEALLNDSLRIAILPDVKTYYEFKDNIIVMTVDAPNKQIIVYFPRINNYTKQLLIDCNNHDEAINKLIQLNSLLKEIINATTVQQKYQVGILQIFSEETASKNYGASGGEFDFCKLLIKEVNNLLYNSDEEFIDFISKKIADKVNDSDRIQPIQDFIRKALNNQNQKLRYYLVACNDDEYQSMMKKLPNQFSPCTLPKNYEQIGYIDYSHQIPSSTDTSQNDDKQSEQKHSNDSLNIDEEQKQVKKETGGQFFAELNNWGHSVTKKADEKESKKLPVTTDNIEKNSENKEDSQDYYS